ncbi:hypothetical protein EDD21DRAFT_436193 [Dissophora ornata]|nr:cofilin [Dissophora ornata]KAI8597854.1 hypothetical protein EDD21DRAFT_436193 [Dissophora ornata]
MSYRVVFSYVCLKPFEELKRKHNYKFIIYKISDDSKEIVVETTSNDGDYEQFLKCFPKDDCRFAICDFQYENEGNHSKILFYTWAPDIASVKSKIIFASTRSSFRRSLIGVEGDIQASDYDEISYEAVLEEITKGPC